MTQLNLLPIDAQPCEFNTSAPMDRQTFQRFVARCIAVLETCEPDRAWDELKALGLVNSVSMAHTFHDGPIWEHQRISARNRALGDKGILSHAFYSLYAETVDYEGCKWYPAHTEGHVQFIRGRIGNTVTLEINVDII
jgi:hypothetical protein